MRHKLLCAMGMLWMVGCTGPEDDSPSSQSQALSAPSLSSLVDGVGVTPEGHLATRFKGQWFDLRIEQSAWTVANAVQATPIAATPTDTSVTTYDCECVPPIPGRACTRLDWINQCGEVIPQTTEQTRTYRFNIGNVSYEVRAFQRIHTERALVSSTSLRLGFAADMDFQIKSVQLGAQQQDDAIWVFGLRPKLSFIDCTFTEKELEQINAEAELTDETTTQTCNAAYSTEVQLSFARTDSLPGASERLAPTNEATDYALGQVVPTPGAAYLSDAEPEAYQVNGNVRGLVQDGTYGQVWDLDRLSHFYLKGRDIGGYSDPASERPLLTSAFPRIPDGFGVLPTQGRTWRFSHTIINQRVRFPVLAGICGFEAFVRSSIDGSVTYGNQSCFNGFVQSVNLNGRLAFNAEAGAGGYCNIIVASASAGLSAGVSTGVEFASTFETLPPALNVSVNQYSDLRFNAYFQTRILFWTKKWSKTVTKQRLWQRGYSYRLLEEVSSGKLCDPGTPDIVDLYLFPSYGYRLSANDPLEYPPPVPGGTFVRVLVAVPTLTGGANLTLQTSRNATITPVSITQRLPSNQYGDLYEVVFPADMLNSDRVRFVRTQMLPTGMVRHLSNWLTIERVIQ